MVYVYFLIEDMITFQHGRHTHRERSRRSDVRPITDFYHDHAYESRSFSSIPVVSFFFYQYIMIFVSDSFLKRQCI